MRQIILVKKNYNILKIYIVNFVYFNNIYCIKLYKIVSDYYMCYKCYESMNKKQ